MDFTDHLYKAELLNRSGNLIKTIWLDHVPTESEAIDRAERCLADAIEVYSGIQIFRYQTSVWDDY